MFTGGWPLVQSITASLELPDFVAHPIIPIVDICLVLVSTVWWEQELSRLDAPSDEDASLYHSDVKSTPNALKKAQHFLTHNVWWTSVNA